MNTLIRAFWLSLSGALLVACAPMESVQTSRSATPAQSVVSPLSGSRILVTFLDERVDRVPIDGPDTYRQRGEYADSTFSRRVAAALAEQYELEEVAQWPVTALGVHCVVYDVPPRLSMDTILRRLGQDQRIESVQTMKAHHVMGGSHAADPYLKMQTGLRSMQIEAAHRVTTGHNVKIAIIDTGIDAQHPDLLGQVSHAENFVGESGEHPSDDIHGTAVAGVIAALAENGEGIAGVAPGASLLSLQACGQSHPQSADAVCNTFTLALALNTAINLRPSIINLSLAGPDDPLLKRLIEKALVDGIIVVASNAGADEPERCFPAGIPGVISAQVAQAGNGAVRQANSRSFAAPGTEILTTLPHGAYNFMSGSSFAAAHVSGLIALLLELRPELTASEITNIFNKTMSGSTGKRAASLSVVNACAAISILNSSLSCALSASLSTATALASATADE